MTDSTNQRKDIKSKHVISPDKSNLRVWTRKNTVEQSTDSDSEHEVSTLQTNSDSKCEPLTRNESTEPDVVPVEGNVQSPLYEQEKAWRAWKQTYQKQRRYNPRESAQM